eukprot:1938628-Pleurochrysis_carterae.AAC.2
MDVHLFGEVLGAHWASARDCRLGAALVVSDGAGEADDVAAAVGLRHRGLAEADGARERLGREQPHGAHVLPAQRVVGVELVRACDARE